MGARGVGLGLVCALTGIYIFRPPTAAGTTPYSVATDGGLVLCSMPPLYDKQKVIKHAEVTQVYGALKYDPISLMLGIYLDPVNIFMRVASILTRGGNRKK